VHVDDLLPRCAQSNKPISYELLKEVVETSDKKRFALSKDGTHIRANQGHSVAVDLGLSVTTPPDKLFHGTASRFLEAIWAQGLTRRERHHVHLTAKLDVAMSVGQRHGQPVILEVDALQMHLDGHKFFQSDNAVWLVNAVAVRYMRLLPQE
jgi:putative RNA 2'-phosphotransferase